MGPSGGPNGSLPAWHRNRSYLHRRSVPLPSRSATRSAHRTTHPATPRPRPGRLHVRGVNYHGLNSWDMSCGGRRARGRRRCPRRPRLYLPESPCDRSTAELDRSGVPDRRSSPAGVTQLAGARYCTRRGSISSSPRSALIPCIRSRHAPLCRDKPFFEVAGDQRPIPPSRVTVATASRHGKPHLVARVQADSGEFRR